MNIERLKIFIEQLIEGQPVSTKEYLEYLAELQKYCQLEADGRLAMLPEQKIGSTVYCPQYIKQCVCEGTLSMVFINPFDIFAQITTLDGKEHYIPKHLWNSQIKSTYEEAEAALKEQN